MKQKTKSRRRARGTRLLTTISVALVLTLAGLVALIGRVATGVTEAVRGEMGQVTVIVADEAAQPQADSLKNALAGAPWCEAMTYTSAEEINEQMRRELGDEDLAEINPFQAEYSIKVKEEWRSADSLQAIATRLKGSSAVYDAEVHTQKVASVNRTINTVMAVLLVVAGIMLIISFALILNTVRLEVYAQRLVIHTMQYVGATRAYIMRPYIIRSLLRGAIAGIIAGIVLAMLTMWASRSYPTLTNYLPWGDVAVATAILMAAGAALSALATWAAASKYLRRNYDEIYEH